MSAAAGPFRVTIVGAGVAGRGGGGRLASLARERSLPVEIRLVEAASRPGGVISTLRQDGFLIEGGPDCFISEKPWAADLCRRLGLGDRIIGTNPECRRSFVLLGRRLLPIPEGYQLMAPGRIRPFVTTPILSPLGKLRAACDLLLPRGAETPDESLASFVRRRFGREVLERLAQPLVAGIYNAEPEELSLRATMPRFLDLERAHRSVILALWRRRSGGPKEGVSGARYSLFVTLRDGLESLIERLVAELPAGALRLGARAAEVAAGGNGGARYAVALVSGETIPSDAVVLAMPAHAQAPLLRGLDGALAGALGAVPYGTSVTVSLGYRSADVPRSPEGFGFVVPRRERRPLIACSFSSVKFAGRAPAGSVLLRNFLGGPAVEGIDPGRLEEMVRGQLREILGITAPPVAVRTCVYPRAMAQYQVGHLARLATLETMLERHPGLALAGNGLRGVGVPDCVRSGEIAADRIAALLKTGSHAPSTSADGVPGVARATSRTSF